jgi:hypothetical protein
MILTMAIRCRSGVLRQLTLCALGLALAGGCARDSPTDAAALRRALGKEIDRYVQSDRAAPPAHCQVLFVGSSSIVVWKRSLAADMAPLPVIDRGFGSSYIEHVNLWFDEIVAPYHPRAIVFYAGENDLNAGKSVDQVVADFDTFMARKSEVLGDTPVYFISLKPSKARFKQLPQQSAVNAAIRARTGTRSDLHFIDVVPLMLESGQPKNIFGPDGLHMTPAGYVLWTAAVKAAVLPNNDAQLKGCEQKEARP